MAALVAQRRLAVFWIFPQAALTVGNSAKTALHLVLNALIDSVLWEAVI
jgi:hypothetical protein